MKKRVARGIAAVAISFSLGIAGFAGSIGETVQAAETYTDKGKLYTARQLLSDYQCFAEKNFDVDNHMAGAIACGGDAALGCFGEAQTVPSYLNHVIRVGNFNGNAGHYLAGKEGYEKYVGLPAYYKTADCSCDTLTKYPDEKGAYIDFEKAFAMLRRETLEIKNQSELMLSEKYLSRGCNNGRMGYLLKIPFSSQINSVCVPEKLLKKADWILLFGVKDINELVLEEHVISLEGKEASLGCDYEWSQTGDEKKAVYLETEKSDGTSFCDEKTGEEICKAYLLDDQHGLKNMTGSECIRAGQMDLSGMKLLWNFPEAEKVNTKYLPGHVIASMADVCITGGNFEGGYIARNIIGRGPEGHFYPFREVELVTPTPCLTPSPTPSLTPKPTPELTPSPSPTPSLTPKPTPELTASPTPSLTPKPTPELTPSPTPSLTPKPTLELTPSPTPSLTPKPTPELTPSPSPTPSLIPKPTPELTPKPTPELTPSPTPSLTPKPTPELTPSPTPSLTPKPTPELTPSLTPKPTPELTASPTPSLTPKPTPELTASPTPCLTPKPTPELTASPSPTPSLTPKPTPELTPSPTPCLTPKPTPELTPSPSPTPSLTPKPTPELTPSPSPTPSLTPKPTPELTPSPSPTPSLTPKPTGPSVPVTTTAISTPTQKISKTPQDTKKPVITPGTQTPPSDSSPDTGEHKKGIYFAVASMLLLAAAVFFLRKIMFRQEN